MSTRLTSVWNTVKRGFMRSAEQSSNAPSSSGKYALTKREGEGQSRVLGKSSGLLSPSRSLGSILSKEGGISRADAALSSSHSSLAERMSVSGFKSAHKKKKNIRKAEQSTQAYMHAMANGMSISEAVRKAGIAAKKNKLGLKEKLFFSNKIDKSDKKKLNHSSSSSLQAASLLRSTISANDLLMARNRLGSLTSVAVHLNGASSTSTSSISSSVADQNNIEGIRGRSLSSPNNKKKSKKKLLSRLKHAFRRGGSTKQDLSKSLSSLGPQNQDAAFASSSKTSPRITRSNSI